MTDKFAEAGSEDSRSVTRDIVPSVAIAIGAMIWASLFYVAAGIFVSPFEGSAGAAPRGVGLGFYLPTLILARISIERWPARMLPPTLQLATVLYFEVSLGRSFTLTTAVAAAVVLGFSALVLTPFGRRIDIPSLWAAALLTATGLLMSLVLKIYFDAVVWGICAIIVAIQFARRRPRGDRPRLVQAVFAVLAVVGGYIGILLPVFSNR
ncbi:hypothetical protein MUN74_18410 [Agromyces endophyticus]|uniref:hypothetical protein n=1 Tax=Agromyces sp. H17E-10 TaxID=2932244 RepID=UPI001FD0AE09|nr:hypothetical protein [Agromyces sp. H17E-10]UOQ89206.1 hypothetical protein MUN74_18410 [Agromyces sp. H17E-10]